MAATPPGESRAGDVLRRSAPRSLVDTLQFPRLFIRKMNEAAVHLAQIVEKDRDVDIFVFVARLERPEPAVKEGVLGPIDQMRDNPFQSKCKSFFAFIARDELKYQNLSDFVDFSLSEMLVDKAVSQAADGLSIDANDFLADIPIAHDIHRSPESYHCRKGFFSFLTKFPSQTINANGCKLLMTTCKLTSAFSIIKFAQCLICRFAFGEFIEAGRANTIRGRRESGLSTKPQAMRAFAGMTGNGVG
jgi:hypothetical protein